MNPDEQGKKQRGYNIIPYRFKKGMSGNPAGRKPGSKSLKTFAREYLLSLTDDEKIEYLDTLPPSLVWQMAEGNPETKAKVTVETEHNFSDEQLEEAKQAIVKRLNTTSSSTTESSSGEEAVNE